ncbi:Frag1/DRAM/Sfk1 [Cadophora sp. MPI-SDFR-AT-0126]|nr:Frag1/DRAM/Sfk1 [Leotiomycetes sp. MPI-SDFR-AT-0126]
MKSNGRIPFISDIAAATSRPLFIGGCSATATFATISFISTRWLRYKRLFVACSLSIKDKRKEFSCLVVVVVSISIGGLALVLLSIFDIHQHKILHWSFVAIFMFCYSITMSLICWELRTSLTISQNNAMRLSYRIKTTVLMLELIIAVPYSVLAFLGLMADIASVLEWIIAFLFIPYMLSMGIDVFYIKGYIYH